jgi:hypothetical protein
LSLIRRYWGVDIVLYFLRGRNYEDNYFGYADKSI